VIRPARPDECAELSALALRSKASWGYDEAFLEACREELTVRPELLGPWRVTVIEEGGRLDGFSALSGDPPEGEIEFLFVEPTKIGAGLGRALLKDVVERASAEGFEGLVVVSDPGAVPFYERMGARRIGAEPSGSVTGRTLPRLRFSPLTLP
jgi:GNAT superfamily N-acetyltransferase